MMKITEIRTRLFEKKLDGTMSNPRYVWRAKRSLLTFVMLNTGHVGVGESWVDAGEAGSIQAFVEQDLASRLVGLDPLMNEAHFRWAIDMGHVSTRRSQIWAGMSAVDTALWDIKAQVSNLPLWQLLGGGANRILPYASGGLYRAGQSIDDFAREYADFIRQGYRAVKIKVGGAPLEVDVERVAKLREAMGAGPRLMVDAVSNYNVPQALAFAEAVRRYDIYWFEQPLATDDVDGMRRLNRDCGIPLCGIENEYSLTNFRQLIASDAVHFVQFDPIISGGITFGRKIAAIAEAWFKPVTLHHSNSVVSMLANIHLAAALPNADSVELHVVHQPLFHHAPPKTFEMVDGYMLPPSSPGLGVDGRRLLEADQP